MRMSSEKIRVDSNLLKSIDSYLRSDLAKSKGFRSRRDVVEEAVRRFLDGEGFWSDQRFKHVNASGDHAIIVDRLIHRVVTVYFKHPDKAYCDVCNVQDCEHVVYALTIKKVSAILREKGFMIRNKHVEKCLEEYQCREG